MKLTESPILSRSEGERNKIHRAMPINKGNDALLIRAHLFECARSTICIQTFIWKNDECGRYNAFLALKAARRGVKIRILVDCWPGLKYPPLLVFLGSVHPNIEVKFYNPPGKKLSPAVSTVVAQAFIDIKNVSHRMHNKAFIADDDLLILGGRNYENAYYDRSVCRNFRDREIAIKGPVVKEACLSFDQYWKSPRSFYGYELEDHKEELEKASYTVDSSREAFELTQIFDEVDVQCGDNRIISTRFADQLREVRHAEFIVDPPGSAGPEPSASLIRLGDFLRQAKRSVLLQSPYFVLDEFFREIFGAISSKKPAVDIRLSTNSLASTDNIIAYATSLRDRDTYLRLYPLQIFEMRPLPADWEKILGYVCAKKEEIAEAGNVSVPPPHTRFHVCIHAKTYVVDSEATCITSANIDPRSACINSEAGIIIHDPDFTDLVKRDIERDIAPGNSWAVGLTPEADQEPGPLDSLLEGRLTTQTACYELMDSGIIKACYDPEFLKNYRSVGPFPLVEGTFRQIEALLLSVLSPAFKPYV